MEETRGLHSFFCFGCFKLCIKRPLRKGYSLDDKYIIPRMICKGTLTSLLSDIKVIPRTGIFQTGSCIGYLNFSENQCFKMVTQIPNSTIASNFINKTRISNLCHVKRSGCDEILEAKTYGEVHNIVKSNQDALVICCLNRKRSPLKYEVLADGPLSCVNSSCCSDASRSSDLLSFGPLLTTLHVDCDYGSRISVIPSWNTGIKKLWFIRQTATARTQKLVNPTKHGLSSQQQLKTIFNERNNYSLLVQEPGDVIKHLGKHYHFVITVVDSELNPSGICLSLGKIDTNLEDRRQFVRMVSVPVQGRKDGSITKATKDNFIKTQLGKDAAPVLKQLKETRKRKRTRGNRGFCKGNKLACKI